MIPIGTRVRIRREAWERVYPHKPWITSAFTIYVIGTHSPFEGMYQLSWPLHWWKEEDLEVV